MVYMHFADLSLSFDVISVFLLFCRVMPSICHLNVTTVRDSSNIKGQGIDIPSCTRETEGIAVRIVKPLSREGIYIKI